MKLSTTKRLLDLLEKKKMQSIEESGNPVDGITLETGGYMDSSQIFMISPKNDKANQLMNFNKELKLCKRPSILLNMHTSSFNAKELSALLLVCQYYKNVKIRMGEDTPISLETDDFIMWLAPRSPEH